VIFYTVVKDTPAAELGKKFDKFCEAFLKAMEVTGALPSDLDNEQEARKIEVTVFAFSLSE